jgi:hypothetical protein
MIAVVRVHGYFAAVQFTIHCTPSLSVTLPKAST